MLNQTTNVRDGKLPVFVFPTTMTFYTDDQSSHKQVLTLYNPYEFALKFKVLCTTPRKYTVIDSEGSIRPRCCVDVVVRHIDICINNEGVADKFRIQVSEQGERTVLGRKEVTAVLLPTRPRDTSPLQEDRFHTIPSSLASEGPRGSHSQQVVGGGGGRGGPSIIVIFAAISCIIALMLPLQGEAESRLPDYLHLSVNQKLIASYALGLVTMLILHI